MSSDFEDVYRSFEELPEGEKGLWRAVDDALFGPDLPQEARALVFARAVDRARGRGELGGAGPALGNRLKELRRELGLTPTQAAERAGVSAGRWRHFEANVSIPDNEELARLGRVLGHEPLTELWRLRRRAPRHQLERLLRPGSRSRVARTASGNPVPREELELLELRNLDPVVREALARHLGSDREDRLLGALREARNLPELERARWLASVADRAELDGH